MITGRPRVLIVDDDAVSLCFFASAVAQLGAEPVPVPSAAAAVAAAREQAPALLILDRRLGDADGADLLRRLRESGHRAPAIATSAELDADVGDALRAAGFAESLPKPIGVVALQAAVARHLAMPPARAAAAAPAPPPAFEPLLDDAGALRAIGGDAAALAALRQLFAAELQKLVAQLDAAIIDAGNARERLHRLRASCGFCGAAALRGAVLELERATMDPAAAPDTAFEHFATTCRLTLAALRDRAQTCSVAAP